MALLGAGRPDDALECFDTAIGIDPNYVWAWAGKAKAYKAKGDGKSEASAISVIRELDKNFPINF
jgi:tetratricopeptide (TPR) repeat protein